MLPLLLHLCMSSLKTHFCVSSSRLSCEAFRRLRARLSQPICSPFLFSFKLTPSISSSLRAGPLLLFSNLPCHKKLRDYRVAWGTLLCMELFGVQMVCNRGTVTGTFVCVCVCVCVYTDVMQMYRCAHLLTRPVLSVSLSESRILGKKQD